MNSTLKVAISVGVALVVGFIVGYGLGAAGKSQARTAQQLDQRRAEEAEAALKQQAEDCGRKEQAARQSKGLLLAKEHLLRATLELYANNYGLASQHLAHARKRLKQAIKGMQKQQAARAQELFDKIGGAQTLAMRLDPMSRIHIERIVAQISKLPGAR